MSNPVLTRTNAEAVEIARSGVEVPHLTSGHLTVAGTMNRAIGLFAVTFAAAAFMWITEATALLLPAMIAGLVFGLWASFSRKVVALAIFGYAIAQGLFLAGISLYFERAYPGIALQAVLATTVTSGVLFVGYRQRWIRVTERFRAIFTGVLLGYLGFSVINLLVSMFSNSSGIYNTSAGWLIALLGVGIASYSLVIDFADIESASHANLPEEFELRYAFGLLVSVLWMYTEILRLLSILQRD